MISFNSGLFFCILPMARRQYTWYQMPATVLRINTTTLTTTLLFQNPEKDICVQTSLVSFVNHYDAVVFQQWIDQGLSKQHAVRHIFYLCVPGSDIFKPNCVSDLKQ